MSPSTVRLFVCIGLCLALVVEVTAAQIFGGPALAAVPDTPDSSDEVDDYPSIVYCKDKTSKCYKKYKLCPEKCPHECHVDCASKSCKPVCNVPRPPHSGPPTPYPSPPPPVSPTPPPSPPPSDTPTPPQSPPPSDTPTPPQSPPPSGTPTPPQSPPPSDTPAPPQSPPPSDTPSPPQSPPPSDTPTPPQSPPPSDTPSPPQSPPPSDTPTPPQSPPPSDTPTPPQSPPPSETPTPPQSPPPSDTPTPPQSPPPSDTPTPPQSPPPSDTPTPPQSPPPSDTPTPPQSPPPSDIPTPPQSPPPSDTPTPPQSPPPSDTPTPPQSPPPSDTPTPPQSPPPSNTPTPPQSPPPSETPTPTQSPPPPSSPPPSVVPTPSPPKEVYCHNKTYTTCYKQKHQCPTSCPDSCEVDCVTCKPVCGCNQPGAICQDPRFIGGDGITFYFHGKKDRDFCVVSDSNLHINAHFIGKRNKNMGRDFTWVQSLGILFDNHQLSIAAKKTATWNEAADRLELSFDGESLLIPQIEGTKIWAAPGVFVTRSRATNEVIIEVSGNFKIKARVVPITEKDSQVHNYGITSDDCFAHLDLGFKFYGLTEQVDGVLGQTYGRNYVSKAKMGIEMPVLGGDRQFASSTLFSTDCAASKFNGRSDSMMQVEYGNLDCASGMDGRGVVCKR